MADSVAIRFENVGRDGYGVSAGALNVADDCFGACPAGAIVDGDASAFAGERQSDTAPETTAGRTGDDGNLALTVHTSSSGFYLARCRRQASAPSTALCRSSSSNGLKRQP